jgi:hypothetical protein
VAHGLTFKLVEVSGKNKNAGRHCRAMLSIKRAAVFHDAGEVQFALEHLQVIDCFRKLHFLPCVNSGDRECATTKWGETLTCDCFAWIETAKTVYLRGYLLLSRKG